MRLITRKAKFVRSLNRQLRICHLFSLIRRLSVHQNDRMAATGCLTIESAGGIVSLSGSSYAMVSTYEQWSNAFDGPHDAGTTARNRFAL